MRVKKTQGVIVKGVILNENSSLVLLLKTKYGYWDLPGGRLEFGETPEECLQREVREEIGQKLNIKGLTSIQTIILDGTDKKDKSELRHYLVLVYKCEIPQFDESVDLKDEKIVEWKWFSVIQLIKEEGKMPVLSLLKEQLLGRIEDTIKTHSKIYLRMGEVKAYRTEEYK